jgi:hypothetical protein
VFQDRPCRDWKFITAACRTTLLVPTDHNEWIGPTILGKRHTNDPFCRAVRLGLFVGLGLGFGWGFVVVVVGAEVVVEVGNVVEVEGTVVVVDVDVVVVGTGVFFVVAATNFTGR